MLKSLHKVEEISSEAQILTGVAFLDFALNAQERKHSMNALKSHDAKNDISCIPLGPKN